MLPNLSTLALSPGNVLVRCPECASLFRKASPTGCANCGGKRKREEEEECKKDGCSCEKECVCDDDAVPDPDDPNMSEQWRNAYWYARGVSAGRLGMDSPEDWQIEAAKRKLAELDEGPPPIVVPEPGDPNMNKQWRNAYRMAGGMAMHEPHRAPPEPWQVEAARRKLAQADPDPDQPPFKSGCTDDDCVQMFSHGCKEDDCEPQFASLGGHDSDDDNAPRPSMSLSDAPDEHPYPPFASTSRLEYEKPAKFRSAGEEKETEEEKEESGWQSAEGSEEESEGESEGDWRDDANFDYYRAVGRPPYTP